MNDRITTEKVSHSEYVARYPNGHPHSISVQGWGKTRSAAVADLKRQTRELLEDARQQNADFVR